MRRHQGAPRARLRVGAALLFLLAAASCGGAAEQAATEPATAPAATTAAPVTTTTAAPVATAAPVTTAAPVIDGLVLHTDAAGGFSILLPDGWQVITPDDADIDDIVDSLGGTEFAAMGDQIRAAFESGGKLFAFSTTSVDPNFVDNINVLVTEAPPVPPSAAVDATARSFEELGAVDVAVELVELQPGPAVRVEYTLPSLGIQGLAYGVRIGKVDWNITLSASDMRLIDFDMEQIANSLDTGD